MIKLFSKKKKTKNDEVPALPRAAIGRLSWPEGADAFSNGVRFAIYEEMLCDPLVRSAVLVKKLGTLATSWRITGGSDINREFIEYCLAEMHGSVTTILFDALDAVAKGFAVMEKVFVIDERDFKGKTRLQAVKPKDPALFGFDVDEFLNVNGLVLHIPGEAPTSLPLSKFVLFAYNQRYGLPMGESDLRAAYRHWRMKRELIKQWGAHLEKFASPTVLGKFKRGLPQDAQNALLDALDKLQRQSAVVYPDDIEVGLLEATRESRSGYAEAIDYHNKEIARAILGQTLTTEDTQRIGSLALGKVHLQVLIMQLAGLRRELAETVMNEQIVRPLIDVNFGPGDYPVFEFEEPELDVFRTGKVV